MELIRVPVRPPTLPEEKEEPSFLCNDVLCLVNWWGWRRGLLCMQAIHVARRKGRQGMDILA